MSPETKKKGGVAERVREMAEPLARELGLSIWDVQFLKEGADWFLRIFIDKEDGVGIDDCGYDPRHRPGRTEDPIPQEYTLRYLLPASIGSL
ncbi:MAG: ribosome maturation factor RimP [Eubacteriales bacterium]